MYFLDNPLWLFLYLWKFTLFLKHFLFSCLRKSIPIFTAIGPGTPTGCHHGNLDPDKNCCSKSNPCGENEGDCDSDKDCFGNLKCGQNNCNASLGFASDYDCCYDPAKPWMQLKNWDMCFICFSFISHPFLLTFVHLWA